MDKVMVDIGGNVWVDVAQIAVIQERTRPDEPTAKEPGSAIFLIGDQEPIFGTDAPQVVISRIAQVAGR